MNMYQQLLCDYVLGNLNKFYWKYFSLLEYFYKKFTLLGFHII